MLVYFKLFSLLSFDFSLLSKFFNNLLYWFIILEKLVSSVKHSEVHPIGSDSFANPANLLVRLNATFIRESGVLISDLNIQLSRIDKASNLGIVKLLRGILPNPIRPAYAVTVVEEYAGNSRLNSRIESRRKQGVESTVGNTHHT